MYSTLVATLPDKLFFAVTMPASQLAALTFSIIDEDLLEDRLVEDLRKSWFDFESKATLESGIDVGQGINVGTGKLDKNNKHRALNKRRA